MTKPKFFTQKFIDNGIRFLFYFLAIALTPLLAKLIAPRFDWVGYGSLRTAIAELFTMLFWGIEGIVFFLVEGFLHKKRALKEPTEESTSSQEIEGEELLVTPEAGQAYEGKRVRKKTRKKSVSSPMPLANVFVLTAICSACILLISAIISFQVKPFYDIGAQVSGQKLISAVAAIFRNCVKCIFIVAMLAACKNMADEVVEKQFPDKSFLVWILAGAGLLLFGIFDIFTSVVQYPMGGRGWLTALAYFLFYIAFTSVYYFTEEHKIKAYFLILLIYIF